MFTSNSETVKSSNSYMYNSAPAQRFYQSRTTDMGITSMTKAEVVTFTPCPYLKLYIYKNLVL